jgi:hypothetical protein
VNGGEQQAGRVVKVTKAVSMIQALTVKMGTVQDVYV